MSEKMILKHCSPTLAGIKTGNMFSCPYKSTVEMRNAVRSWNKTLSVKGLRILPLKYNGDRALIYIFRPSLLSRDLQNASACNILHNCGYKTSNINKCIAQLVKRVSTNDDFPHEIGLFLGYPPEDVYGFIENKANCYKCTGCWKVYGNEENAKKTFAKYKKCTDIYCKQYSEGKSIERLTVVG